MLEIGAISAALMGALAYGTGDFAGSRAAFRLSTNNAVVIAQSTAMLLLLQDFAANRTPLPGGGDLVFSLLAGLAYSAGVILLYHGLAHGRIGVVAPLCGLFSIVVPLLGDVLIEQIATGRNLIGIGFCGVAVVAIAFTTEPDPKKSAGYSIRLGVASGLGYGFADLWLGLVPPDAAMGSLLVTRTVAAFAATGLLTSLLLYRSAAGPAAPMGRRSRTSGAGTPVVGTSLLPMPPSIALGIGLAVMAGGLDVLGHLGYLLSAQDKSMAVAAALVALFPAVSVALAVLILKETIHPRQWLGFAAAILGVGFATS